MDQRASHHPESSHRVESFAGLVFCLIFPSLGVIQKYSGNLGLAAYVVLTPPVLWVVLSNPGSYSWLSDRTARYLVALTFLLLIVVFAILYPKANVHIAGRGSDADDGLNMAVVELLHGRYPYYVRTYLDNSLSPMPGAIFLAAPFVLLGSSAFQNLFWLGVFCFVLSRMTKSWRPTLILFWIILIFSPVVMSQVVTGGDYPSNAIYVLVFLLLLVSWMSRADAQSWKRVLAALLLGIGLSSRANFLLVMPPLFSALLLKAGWHAAMKYSAFVVVVCTAVTLPFWIYDPAGFTPFRTQAHKVAEFQAVLPSASLIVPALGACLALALAWLSTKRGRETWLRDCAIVQAFLVICVVILSVIQTGTFSLLETSYGVFFLFFGVMALGPKVLEMSDA